MFCKCSLNLAGSETETQTGTVSAKVLRKSDNTLFSNKPVILHSSNDTPYTSITTTTDNQGTVFIDAVEIGSYFLEIGDTALAALIPCNVIPNEEWFDTIYTLPTGVIIGNLCVPFIGTIFTIDISINEINRSFQIDSTGIFTIPFLPAFSQYTLSLFYKTASVNLPIFLDSISITSGDTTNIGNIALFHGNARIFGTFPKDTLSVHHATLTITAYNLLPITTDLTIVDTTVYGVVEGIPEGLDRIFEAQVRDSHNVVLYSGKDTTDITANNTSTLFINLGYKNKGF